MTDGPDFEPPTPPQPFTPPSFTPPPPPFAARTGPPWEQDGTLVDRFVNTVRGIVTDPKGFFQTMRREGGLGTPLLYAFVGNMIGWLMALVYQTLTPFGGGLGEAMGGFVMMMFILPVAVLVGLFLWSGLLHVVLSLLDGARQPFETTFRVVAYTSGTTSLANIVPWCGGFIGAAVAIAFTIIGLSEAHEIPVGKSAIAVLVPLVICCGLGLLIVVTMFGLAALGIGAAIAGAK
jgi:hypothetical protein